MNKVIDTEIIADKDTDKRKKIEGEKKFRDNKNRVLTNGESQRQNGKYRYTYVGLDGKPHEVSSWKLVPTDRLPAGKRQCLSLREMEKDIKRQLEMGIIPKGNNITVSELIEMQLASEGKKKKTTRKNDNSNAKYIMSSELGNIRIDKVYEEYLKDWLTELQESGKHYSSIFGYWKIIKKAFKYAEKKKWISDSPTNFKFEDYVVDDSQERMALKRYEKKTFLEFVKNHPIYSRYYDEIYILFYSGLRISELVGLTFNDLDFENRLMNIDHQLHKGDDGYYVSSLKGRLRGKKADVKRRSVPMMKGVPEALQRIIEKRPKVGEELVVQSEDERIPAKSGFIILGQTKMPKYAKLYENYFRDICEEYNACHPEHPLKVTPHICRHTFCTDLADMDVNPIKLQAVMGHSDLKTTARYYKNLDMKKFAIDMQAYDGKEW